MGDINISRREILKTSIKCCVLTPVIPLISLIDEVDASHELVEIIDSDYVVVNGWVLLKSDVAMG